MKQFQRRYSGGNLASYNNAGGHVNHIVQRAFIGLDRICTAHENGGGEREDCALTAREVISMLSQQTKHPITGRPLTNRNLPSIAKITRLMKSDSRFTIRPEYGRKTSQSRRMFYIDQDDSVERRAATDTFISCDAISVNRRGGADKTAHKNKNKGDENHD